MRIELSRGASVLVALIVVTISSGTQAVASQAVASQVVASQAVASQAVASQAVAHKQWAHQLGIGGDAAAESDHAHYIMGGQLRGICALLG